ncbi:response regulator [Pseudomonas citronellolis]|uniref:response regulator n=1 Tax=Pseudomonas citronellolis TaxID=53408 RepID=UPI001E2BC672|nr:response regulator [Pseudomonas citronellolis]
MHKGAQWIRAGFHLHTCADSKFKFTGDDNFYNSNYVDALEKADSQHQNDVIIIDRPEDDLDNQAIYDDVIKLLREMKPHAQFIFVTHNANLPVLGDAEQVYSCRYQDEKVAVQSGSIDARPVQDAIINIMEGGQEAFNRRKEVYNRWKPQS